MNINVNVRIESPELMAAILAVKFEIVESHIEEDKEYVDEVAFTQAIEDSKEAMREFRKCKQGQFVYSTKNENLIIELIKHVGIRKSM